MWTRGVAIRPVPSHAIVEARTVDAIRAAFSEDDEHAQHKLDDAFSRFESTQPALSARLGDALDRRGLDDTARALGYFLGVCVWLTFEKQFGNRLERVDEISVRANHDALELERELRATRPDDSIEVDDVVAREQPALVAFVNEHVDVALDGASGHTADVDDVHTIYQVILVELLSLSHAVAPHPGARRSELLA